MIIEKTLNGKRIMLKMSGRLDTTTAPRLEAELQDCLVGTEELILDLEDLDYISSAGLRVLLATQKKMKASAGTMKLIRVSETVMEIFQITGFTDILTIE